MRIGVDATCWSNPRGYGRFTRELLPELAAQGPDDEFVCFLDERTEAAFTLSAPNVVRAAVWMRRAPAEAASADGSRSVPDMLRLTRAVGGARVDVFFSPSVYTFFPLPPGLPAVVTVHDAIAERFPHLTLPSRRARLFWKMKVAVALRQARLVLTVSEFAAGDLVRTLGISRDRIRVALEAPAPAYRRPIQPAELARAGARVGLPAGVQWFVYVGGFNPHKNLDVLVRAHAQLAARLPTDPPHLVLVGPGERDVFHTDEGRLAAAIDQCGTRRLVHFPGFVSDEDMRGVHAGAVATVLPSACEGFGLPAVEAAACGAPVIATRESPLPDLLRGGGIFVEPGDVDGLANAMQRLRDPALRAAMGGVAQQHALALTWSKSAVATMGALREAVA
jgi:glycosyltransferase involved in cell wall biosynthesis